MIKASGYVLIVPHDRALTLLEHAGGGETVGEPVPVFELSRRAPILVLACFQPGAVTHIAIGRKGVASGTRLVRLNLTDLVALTAVLPIDRLLRELPARNRAPVGRRLREGGPFSPAAFDEVVAALLRLAPDLAPQLMRFSGARSALVKQLSDRQRSALAEQKEGVGLALKIAGLDTRVLLDWSPPPDNSPSSFLEGLPHARVREDAMIVHDLGQIPGFNAVRDYAFAAKVFEGPGTRLTVILANKLPLEEQFGTDLIYYNETFKSFVMVQYKAMERPASGRAEFRLPNAQLDVEIARMDQTLETLAAIEDGGSPIGFRFHASPFFFKLCARHLFNPDDSGLFPGMYLPLDYWRRLVADDATLGARGGRLITYENVGRKLSESEFIALTAGGWIGTNVEQSGVLETIVREVLSTGRSVTLAVREGLPDGLDARSLRSQR